MRQPGDLGIQAGEPTRRGHLAPVILGGCGIAAVIVGGLLLRRVGPSGTAAWLAYAIATIDGTGVWAPLALFCGQILVASSGVLPASLLGLAAGALYGIPVGFALSAVSTMAGAVVAFRLSRSLFRARMERLLRNRPRLADFDQRLATDRWKLVCLLRVSPVMPFAATSYMLGLSAVRERDYLVGTAFALPALFGFVCLGSIARAGIDAGTGGAHRFQWALLALGLVATLGLTLRVGQLIARSVSGPGR